MTSGKKENIHSSTLLVWDTEAQPPTGDWTTVLWCSFPENNDDTNVISIPKLVEEQADELRSRYLTWLYDLGESEIRGVRLIDRLAIRPDFSYWWMTLPTIFSYDPQTPIYTVIRLLALEKLVDLRWPIKILLVSNNKLLARTIGLWCKNTDRDFEWKRIKKTKTQLSWFRTIYYSLPYALQSSISLLRYIWHRWPLKQTNIDWATTSDADVTFVDYLCHLSPEALSTGRFASNYWTSLINVLTESGFKTNWIHHYINHPAVPSTQKARDLIANFNHNETTEEFHTSLDSVLSIHVLLGVLRDYIHLLWINIELSFLKKNFDPAESSLNLWPLLKKDWCNYMTGPLAISNCLFLNLFEKIIPQIPYQRLGIYLQENQPWEMAFIYAWRTSGHGQLIGVPHSTVRYWDLRYFFAPRSYETQSKNSLPMPDRVAVNGPVSMKRYREGGYPEEQLIEVEALRYLGLVSQLQVRDKTKPKEDPLRVLVLGDYFPSLVHQQMQLLEKAAQKLPSDTFYTVKPHPSSEIETSNYPSLKCQITNAPLVEVLSNYDVVFTSNGTSAAVDAYCAGVPVVSLLDRNTFNLSPVRGLENVIYVLNSNELVYALQNVQKRIDVVGQPYFCFDRKLLRWQTLFAQKILLQQKNN